MSSVRTARRSRKATSFRHHVAGFMAEGVIELFEFVDIGHDHAQTAVAARWNVCTSCSMVACRKRRLYRVVSGSRID